MLTILLTNLQMIGFFILLVLGGFVANTALGVAKSSVIYEDFSWDVLKKGLIKGACIVLGIFLVTTVSSMVAPICAAYGITIISESVIETISIAGVLVPLVSATVLYWKDAVAKIYEIFHLKKEDVLGQ